MSSYISRFELNPYSFPEEENMMYYPKFAWDAEDEVAKGITCEKNIEEIKKWINEHPNVPRLSDEQIVLFLTSCDNNLLDTTTTIVLYFKCRYCAPEFFTDRYLDSESVKQAMKTVESAVMSNRTKDNYGVIVSRLKDTNYWNWNVENSIKYLFMCLEVVVQDNPVKGLIVIFDLKGVGLMHLTRLKIGVLRKFFTYLQEGLPIQLKEIHIMNSSYIFDKILIIIKPFMKKELIDLLNLHTSSYDMGHFFENHAPANCIPADYGGSLPPMEVLCQDTSLKFSKLRKYFEDDEKQCKLFRKEK